MMVLVANQQEEALVLIMVEFVTKQSYVDTYRHNQKLRGIGRFTGAKSMDYSFSAYVTLMVIQ